MVYNDISYSDDITPLMVYNDISYSDDITPLMVYNDISLLGRGKVSWWIICNSLNLYLQLTTF